MTLDEKIGQLLLVRYPTDKTAVDIQKKYQFGGYLFFEKDFKDKNETEVKNMIKKVQEVSKIPLLTAVDEEGGIIVRVSTNPKLVPSKFLSPSALYKNGGFENVKKDTINKSKILYNLGINLNLAPVVDISTSSTDYMYRRSLQQNATLTSTFAETVINASKGTNVSYCLKHFPGYGNNLDTHIGSSIDNRTYENILTNDIIPFDAGIKVGAETVMVSHNIVTSIDKDNPASLSPSIHNLLRNELSFTGIIITDALDMGAIKDVGDATVRSILSGNDFIITTDYEVSVNAVKSAIDTGKMNEDIINKLCLRVLAWKYSKGLIK
jgi:beta-N-acetylhexosaminidase